MDSTGNLKISYSYAVRVSLVIIILIATSFLPAELFAPTLVFCGLLVLFVSNGHISTCLVNTLVPLLIVFLTGLAGIFHHEPFHIFRDIAYALTPVSLLITGYWMAGNSQNEDLIVPNTPGLRIYCCRYSYLQIYTRPETVEHRISHQ